MKNRRNEKIGKIILASALFFALWPNLVLAVPTTTNSTFSTEVKPLELNVKIPGLTFTTPTESGGQLEIPFLAQYITAIYNYMIGVAILAAAVMIVYGGFRYIVGASLSDVTRGKQIITDALIGLLLLLGAFTILNTINPATTTMTALTVKPVLTDDIKYLLENNLNFSSFDSTYQDKPTRGNAPVIAPQVGENISLKDVDLSKAETYIQLLKAFCTDKEKARGLTGYDAKIQNLVRAVLGFKYVCEDLGGCGYIRGGATDFDTEQIGGTAFDFPFVLSQMSRINQPFGGSEGTVRDMMCMTEFERLGGKKGYYDEMNKLGGSIKDSTVWENFAPGGSCYKSLQVKYDKAYMEPFRKAKVFAGDCAYTVFKMYECAGGTVAIPESGKPWSPWIYTSGQRANKKVYGSGPDWIVEGAANYDDMLNQIAAKGGLKFGDIVVMPQHTVMFTGGREDVPFEFIEMGSVKPPKVPPHVSVSVSGVVTWPKKGEFYYLQLMQGPPYWQTIFPMNIYRPYQYEPCETKNDCGDNQVCHCVEADKGDYKNNKCNMRNLCHRASTLYCHDNDDEQCFKGFSCKTVFTGPNQPDMCCLTVPGPGDSEKCP